MADRGPGSQRTLWSDGLGRVATRSAQSLIVLALVACVVFALTQLRLVVVTVLIATIVAAAVNPVVHFLREHRWPAGLATWTALLAGLGTLGGVIWLVGRGIRDEWGELVDQASQGIDQLEEFLLEGPLDISEQQIADAREAGTDLLTSEGFQSGAVAGATAAVEVIAGLLLGIVVLFFLLRDGRRISEFLITPLDERRKERARRIGNQSTDVLGRYVRGTAIVALVDAVVIGVALMILGVPLALPLATIVFLGAFVPIVGATVAGTFAALVALVAEGPLTALIVVIVVIAVNQLEGDLLAPVVIGKALSLHPLAILLALTAGTILAGILGALLAVPIAAVAWAAVKEWHAPADDEHSEAHEEPDERGSAEDSPAAAI
ncbi:AI-2E family transporter [Actinotalea sp. BY-33]|uniref:AI-2E family transporter n=1 Tax=Actinotalea soli TaxID=2819234 RepID=A0A939LN01_9CELL|nr:AI-2E family transporter [Actinotalea soli]MBO1750284.1 AI-2E family transporter [Actinotalea soli]